MGDKAEWVFKELAYQRLEAGVLEGRPDRKSFGQTVLNHVELSSGNYSEIV